VEQLLSNYGPYAFGVVAVYFIWRFMVVPDKKMNLEQAKIHLTTAQTMKEVTQELRYSYLRGPQTAPKGFQRLKRLRPRLEAETP